MFFTENILKILLSGILLSLAGNNYTSETSDVAVVSTTTGNSSILGDLIEGPDAQYSVSKKSSVTESFDFGQNCHHFVNETSSQCFPNLEKVQPLVVLHNVSGNSETGKDFNLTVEANKNEWQFCETSATPNSRFSFLKGRIAITDNIKYLLDLDPVQKAFLLLVFLLCFICKSRKFLRCRLKTITKVHSKYTVPRAAVDETIQLPNSKKDTGISSTPSEKSSLAENDTKPPLSIDNWKTASFLNDLPISSLKSDSKSGDSSDDDFSDEFFLVGSENGCNKHMLIAEDWEPIDLAQYDSSSESHGVGKKGSIDLVQTNDWKLDLLVDDGIMPVTSPSDQHKISNDIQMNDLPMTSSSNEEKDTSSHTLQDNTTNLHELKGLNGGGDGDGDGDNCVALLGDRQDDHFIENEHSLPENLMEDVKDLVSDDITNPGEMRNQKFVAPSVERVDCENSRSSSPDCEEVATNLTRMRNWKLDDLSFENIKMKNSDTSVNCVASSSTNIGTSDWSLDNLSYEGTIDNCPDSMTADTDKAILVTSDLRFDDYIDSDKNCESDEEEFPDEFFLFAKPDDKTKCFIATKDLYPDDIVGCDEDEEEFPDEFFLFANPDDETKRFIATKDLHPEDLVSYDDVINSPNSDVMLPGDQSDIVTESPEDLNSDETDEDVVDDTVNSVNSNALTLIFLSIAFVLPCILLRSS